MINQFINDGFMKKKALLIVSVSLITVIAIIFGMYYCFFVDISRIRGQELIDISVSPNSTYTIEVFRNNGGATTDYSVLCRLHYNNKNKKDRNIYCDYHCDTAEIEWLDDDTVIINGQQLDDVTKDKFDYRND